MFFFSCFLYTHTYIHRYTRGLALLLFNEVLSQEEMTRKDKMRTVGVAIEMLSALAFLVHVGRESDKELSMNVRDVARAQEILLQKRKSNSSTEKYVMKAADVVVKMMSSTGESHLLTGSRDSCEFSHIVWEEFLCANHIVDDLLCVSVHDATKRIQHYVGDHDAMLKISTESSSASLKDFLISFKLYRGIKHFEGDNHFATQSTWIKPLQQVKENVVYFEVNDYLMDNVNHWMKTHNQRRLSPNMPTWQSMISRENSAISNSWQQFIKSQLKAYLMDTKLNHTFRKDAIELYQEDINLYNELRPEFYRAGEKRALEYGDIVCKSASIVGSLVDKL